MAPKLEIQDSPLGDLLPYDNNPRKNDDVVDRMAAAIQQYGFRVPILVRKLKGKKGKHQIVDGHLRFKAAQRLELESIPTIDVSDLSDDEVRALRLMMNKSAEWAEWDSEKLSEELRALIGEETTLDQLGRMTGFGLDELEALLADKTEGLTDPDEAPPLSDTILTVPGDVWLLGEHRLVCGDATKAEDVAKALGGLKPLLMVTDPPYGVNYDPAWRQEAGVGSKGAAIGKVKNDDQADWREAWALFPGKVAYVWHGGLHAAEVMESLMAVKFRPRAQIIWVKTRPALSRGHYHWQHEPALYVDKEGEEDGWRYFEEHEDSLYVVKGGATANWKGGRKQSTVWFIEHLKNDTGHGTQKPVECMRRPIINNSAPGQPVYDPFLGSGTTIIAAEMEGRQCVGLELDPAYCDVIIKRWQNFTGKKATLQDGTPIDKVADARL